MPAQSEKFWSVNTNKENLQLYTRKIVQMIDNLILSNMVVDNEIVTYAALSLVSHGAELLLRSKCLLEMIFF